MASALRSAVTIVRAWTEGGTSGKALSCRLVRHALVTCGTAANPIPASALELTKIEQSSPAVLSDDTLVYLTCPSYDGTTLFLVSLNVSTDADRAKPIDVNGVTVQYIVKGYL